MSGCAYFNTFYAAQKSFKDAERQLKIDKQIVTQANKKNYNDSIEAAAEVVRDYPECKYVDDSLFIIGISYFRIEDYNRAIKKFDEILQAFPGSEFAAEAKYYRAKCLIEMGMYDNARIMLNDLIATGSRSQKGRAGLALVDIALRDNLWDDLLKAAQNVIDSDPEKEELYRAIAFKGEALYQLERYDECVKTMEELLENKLETDVKLKGNLQIALAKAKLGLFDESLGYLDNMQSRGEFADKAPAIRLQMGKIYELQDNTEKAIETYRTLAGDFPDSLASKEAWYRVGKLLLIDLSNTEEAQKAFENVKKNKARTAESWIGEADILFKQIDTMKSRIEKISDAKDDSLKKAYARFSLAELYTFSFDRPDSALTQYRLILEEAPETDFAVRSEYFIGLHEMRSEDRYSDENDRELMQKIIDRYPESTFSHELRVHLGIIEKPPEIKAFMEAELACLSGQGADIYMPLYQAVTDSFPETESAFRARFVMAYFYEHDVGDIDKSLEIYTGLSGLEENIYNREFVRLAKRKLEHVKEEPKLIDQIKKNIAYLTFEMSRIGTESSEETGDVINVQEPEEEELTGFRKIRERNARIRSRYYKD